MGQVRDEERQHDQVSQQDDVVHSEQAAPSKTRFTNQGPIPAVENGVGAHGPSASDRAFGSLTVTARGLNVRSGPSTNDQIVGKLHRGDTVQELGRANGWVQISFGSTRAYVHGAYVTSGENEAKAHAPSAEGQAEAMELFREVNGEHGRGAPPSKESQAEVMEMFREVNGGPASEKGPAAETSAAAKTAPGQGHAPSKESQAEVMEMFREVNGDHGRGAPPSKESQAEVMADFREVNGGPASEKQAPAQGHAPSKEKLAELVAELE